jgi:Zn-dependent metalloprotease
VSCHCFIIPTDVLERMSKNKKLSPEARKAFADAAAFETHWRKLRALQTKAAVVALQTFSARTPVAATAAITVYDCSQGTTLPGTPLDVATTIDATAKRAVTQTTAVAEFFKTIFNRNSVDNLGMTLQSSVHYGSNYNNAFWNGVQMTYGDGDGNIFLDFTKGADVIGHELTHGVTQHSSHLSYANEAGGLNESIADVFGIMFKQWQSGQTAAQADWLLGGEILGPGARAQGYSCLRDLAKPAAKHCLAPQPVRYSKIKPGMDPHVSSGVPNLAFCRAAKKIGGKSWETAGQIWYRALTGYVASPNLKMRTFANRTRKLSQTMYAQKPAVYAAVDQAWKSVGL